MSDPTLNQLVSQARKLTESLKEQALNAQQLLDLQKGLSRLNEALGQLATEAGDARTRGVNKNL